MPRSNGRSRFKQRDGIQSAQERDVKAAFPHLQFKPKPLAYVREHLYNPDLKLGKCASTGRVVYVELKEYMTVNDCAKYEDVVKSNPHVIVAFVIYSASNEVFYRLGRNPNFWVAQGWLIPDEWFTRLTTNPQPVTIETETIRPPSAKELNRDY